MKAKIKRFDKTIPLPAYKSKGAVCADLYARETVTIQPGKVGIISLNIALEIPKGFWVMVVPRGSTHKQGILMIDSMGVMDEDFCGDNDEYIFPGFNFTDHEVTIEKGTRIAQMIMIRYEKFDFEEVDHLGNPDRGKLGSTGRSG
jgi:dUTP pyrophosphatase